MPVSNSHLGMQTDRGCSALQLGHWEYMAYKTVVKQKEKEGKNILTVSYLSPDKNASFLLTVLWLEIVTWLKPKIRDAVIGRGTTPRCPVSADSATH